MSEIPATATFGRVGQTGRGAIDALAAAKAAGITLTRNGDKILLEAPDLPDDIVAQLRAAKPGLLRVLAGRDAARAALNAEPPPDCSDERWAAARLGLQRFMAEGWGDQAILLGWTVEELYSLPALWGRVDLTGAALLIADRKVAAITETSIAIATPTGSLLRFRRVGREHVD